MAEGDRLGEDVRIPQAASGTKRRKTLHLAVTVVSAKLQIRAATAADSEMWFTMQHQIPTNAIHWHGGPDTVLDPLPVATTSDWIIPPSTERSYKLGRGETHIAVIAAGGAGGDLAVYPSSD